MFRIARGLMRHKVGSVAVIAFAVVMFTRSEEKPYAPSSPWAADAPVQVAQAQDDSMVDKAVDGVTSYLDEKGLNPLSAKQEHADSWTSATSAFDR
jgi:hypothetical protein